MLTGDNIRTARAIANELHMLDDDHIAVEAADIEKLTDEELRESENYEDFESFLSTIERKYGFKLNNCQWMVTENLDIYCYRNGEETELNLL